MKNYRRRAFAFLVVFSLFSFFDLVGNSVSQRWDYLEAKITESTPPSERIEPLDEKNPQIEAAVAIQNRHIHELMAVPNVVGIATALSGRGAAILVLAKEALQPGIIAESLEGLPVIVQPTGEISAMSGIPTSSSKSVSNTSPFPLPVPIGVSTGNIFQCEAGTIGARVKDAFGNVFALSNNHVFALENMAPIGSPILQPGLVDTSCGIIGNNLIGLLYKFVPINFGGGANLVDAAIAYSTTKVLGNSTPPEGYGTPNSVILPPSIGQAVQKYGRTTSLTTGVILAINANVLVTYGPSRSAEFSGQIVVSSPTSFILPGDSGSLLVTNNPSANPVGLVFAGSGTGQFAIANPIGPVLSAFAVTIDGR